jgi:hypothetical protein
VVLFRVEQDSERFARGHDRIEEPHMDPQAAWEALLEARQQRDWDRAEELANSLLEWLNKQGFPPETVGSRAIGRGWHRAVAQFVCYLPLNDVQAARKRVRRKRA